MFGRFMEWKYCDSRFTHSSRSWCCKMRDPPSPRSGHATEAVPIDATCHGSNHPARPIRPRPMQPVTPRPEDPPEEPALEIPSQDPARKTNLNAQSTEKSAAPGRSCAHAEETHNLLANTFVTDSDFGRKEILAGAGRQRSDSLLTAPARISCGRSPPRGSVFWRFPAQSNARGRARVSPSRGRCEAAPACPRPPRVATPQRGLIRLLGRAWQASATGAVPPSQNTKFQVFSVAGDSMGKRFKPLSRRHQAMSESRWFRLTTHIPGLWKSKSVRTPYGRTDNTVPGESLVWRSRLLR